VVILGACSDDSSSAPATTTTTTTTTAATTSTVPPSTIASPSTTATTSRGPATEDHAGPATIESTPLTGGGATSIEINADQVGSNPSTQTVKINTPVSVSITTARPQEFLLQGYNLRFTDRLEFIADRAGTFEVQNVKTQRPVMWLAVAP